jgi:Lar family restriction alleviation protein
MNENLLPCPFCGGESKLSALQSIIDDRKIADRYYIVCLDCGVQTAMLATIEKAIAAWNRRAVPQETETPITEDALAELGFLRENEATYIFPVGIATNISITFFTFDMTTVEIEDPTRRMRLLLPNVTTIERVQGIMRALSTE